MNYLITSHVLLKIDFDMFFPETTSQPLIRLRSENGCQDVHKVLLKNARNCL